MATYKRKIAAQLPGTDQYFVKETTRPNVRWCVMTRLPWDDQWRARHWFAQHSDALSAARRLKRNGLLAEIVPTQDWA